MLPLAAVLFLVCLAGVTYFAAGLLRTTSASGLASVPVDRESEVTLPAGEVVVDVETPRLSQEYRQFEVELIEARTAQVAKFAAPSSMVGRESYGVTTARIPFGRMTAREGKYFVRVGNVRLGADYSTTRVILSRPYMGQLVGRIIGLVFCAVGALGSLIWGAWLAGWMKQSG